MSLGFVVIGVKLSFAPKHGLSRNSCSHVELDFSFRKTDREKVVLDVRNEEAFRRGHLPQSTWIPAAELETRLLELPPPFEDPLTLVAETKNELKELGYRSADCVVRNLDIVDFYRQLRPRVVVSVVYDEKQEFREELPHEGIAIDYGCGSGRDAVYMAQNLPGWRVIGIDNHSKALDRAAVLADQSGVKLDLRCIDLRKTPDVGETADFAHGCRFLCRDLLVVIRDKVVRERGWFAWSTFLEAEGNSAPPFRPSRRLRPNELRTTFPDDHFETIHDSYGVLNTRGVNNPAAFFACRRRPRN